MKPSPASSKLLAQAQGHAGISDVAQSLHRVNVDEARGPARELRRDTYAQREEIAIRSIGRYDEKSSKRIERVHCGDRTAGVAELMVPLGGKIRAKHTVRRTERAGDARSQRRLQRLRGLLEDVEAEARGILGFGEGADREMQVAASSRSLRRALVCTGRHGCCRWRCYRCRRRRG